MTVASLFCGVGGFDVALERLGHQVVWANENNRYAADIYDYRFAHPVDRRDITTVPTADIPNHDLLVGGIPCQSWSVAGKRGGFDDARGNMWWEFVRVLTDKQPRYFIAENVKGLLSHAGGNSFERICAALCTAGYAIDFDVLNSKHFGVPQSRERLFIVGIRHDLLKQDQLFQETLYDHHRENETAATEQPEHHHALLSLPSRYELYTQARRHSRDQSRPAVLSLTGGGGQDVIEVTQGVPQSVRAYDPRGLAPTLFGNDSGGGKTPKIIEEAPHGAAVRGRSNGVAVEIRDDGLANALRASEGGSSKPLVAYPGHTVNEPDRPARALKAGVHGVPGGEGLLRSGLRIRRLTPLETEKLQALPDHWTAYGKQPDGTIYPISNSQRYKATGNAVTTSVVYAIAERLPHI